MLFKKKSDKVVKIAKHVAIDFEGAAKWVEENNSSLNEAYKRSFELVNKLMEEQTKLNFPVLTFFVMSPSLRGTKQAEVLLEHFSAFLEHISFRDKIVQNKIKVTVIGKWYDLDAKTVEAVRKVSEETRDYDSFFLNFCLNYDGQEEIVDALKLVGRQIRMGKVDPEMVNKQMIKDNLYSSYFISPDLIIRNGKEKRLSSLLLWDSVGARIHFSNKNFPEFTADDFIRVLVGK